MIFKFTPPVRYDLTQIILGESTTLTGILQPVASSLIIGTFPQYITTYEYAQSSENYYYGIKWEYDNGGYSNWGKRLIGRTGIETDYIIVNAPDVSSIFIMNPVSGDVATTQTNWLEANKEYYVTVMDGISGGLTYPLKTDYTFTFTSAFCPLFSSVNDVRYEVGDFINNLTDDTINRIIHKNSKYIITKYVETHGAYPTNYTCDGSLIHNAFTRYVLCKSALDAITAIQLSTGGKTMKKLADVTFEYGGIDAGKDPNNKKQALKECIDASLHIIFSGYNFQIGVRGKSFSKQKHPMYDPSYGRLSTINKDEYYDYWSKFDQILNSVPEIQVTSGSV